MAWGAMPEYPFPSSAPFRYSKRVMGESQDQSQRSHQPEVGLWNRACPWLSPGAFAVIILLGVLLRVVLILAWPQPIKGTDASQYLQLATNLVEGNSYSLWPNAPYDPDVYV